MKDKFGYKLFDPIAPSFSHWDNWSFHKKLFRFSLICFFWIEHIPLKISWKHGIIDIGIIFSNPLPRMHRLRAHHNLWKRHPYEINEARPLSKQLDCKLNLTNLVFRVVLYHSLGIVYNAGNYSSVDMQWILFHPPKRYSKALKNTPLHF